MDEISNGQNIGWLKNIIFGKMETFKQKKKKLQKSLNEFWVNFIWKKTKFIRLEKKDWIWIIFISRSKSPASTENQGIRLIIPFNIKLKRSRV